MRDLLHPYRYLLAYAAIASFFLDLLLVVPSIYMMQVFDRVMNSRSEATLFWLTLLAGGLMFVYFIVEWLRGRLTTSASLLLDRLLSSQALRIVLEDAHQPGMGRYTFLMRDVTILRGFISGPAFTALLEAPWMPLFLLVIFLVHPLLGSIALVASICMFALAMANNRFSKKPLEELQLAGRKAGSYIDISTRNAEAVHAMGMFPAVVQRWSGVNRNSLRLQSDTGRLTALISGLNKFSRQFIQIIMLAAGVYLVLDSHITPGVTIACTFILGRALAPVDHLIASWKMLADARAAYRRLDEAIRNSAESRPATQLPALRGALETERVTFGVAPGKPALIKGVSFRLEPGQMLGLIGPSGSGKTTLVRLLTGVWRAQAGSVRLDGADIQQWVPEQLGPQIGYLPQDIELFPGTVSENIARLGEPDSEAVIAAAIAAGAHDMILRLPNGYDTEIGPGGSTLSGGQRQRIGLARAIYRNPRIVILDEPNAYLDADGEAALLQTMRQLKRQGVTQVVITHKPSLLTDADRLMVLRDGAISLFGESREVLAKLRQGGPASTAAPTDSLLVTTS